LKKVECMNCKLIRSGSPISNDELRDHYESQYQLGKRGARGEPLFFLEKGPVPRSKVVFDWFLEALSQAGFANPKSILEIGCGEGSLLQHFANKWRDCKVNGLDFNEKGLDVRKGGYKDVTGRYDLIFSFAVIEHVPSPSDFFSVLKSHLSPTGTLLVAQPCQDNGSNDIFFSDHLWHFFSHHLTKLGEQQGLSEELSLIGSKNIPNFSLHIFDNRRNSRKTKYSGAPKVKIHETLAEWERIFQSTNKWLKANEEKDLAVWGLGQTFTLFRAYTILRNQKITAAFEDNQLRYDQKEFDFPVLPFDSLKRNEVHKLRVLLTFKPANSLTQMFKEMSISYYSPFEGKN
jgi:SAM-dependent methyltransferase